VLWYRRKRYGYEFRRIPLTQNKFAIVDIEDYEKLSVDRWHLFEGKNNFYAARTEGRKNVFMHRRIMRSPSNSIVDHINRNGLDNRKANLRIVSNMQNCWNSDRGINKGTSKYKGVRMDKRSGRWYASIRYEGKKMYLGVSRSIFIRRSGSAVHVGDVISYRLLSAAIIFLKKLSKNILKTLKMYFILYSCSRV